MAAQCHPPDLPILQEKRDHFTCPMLPNDFNGEVIDIVLVILHGWSHLTFFLCNAVVTPNWAFLGSHNSTCFPNLEKRHCSTEGHSPQPLQTDRGTCLDCFGWKTGPNSTNSLRTIGSFFKRKKKSSPCGPYFLGTFQCVDAVRKRTLSHRSKEGQTLSHKGLFHISGTVLEPSRPQGTEYHFHNKSRAKKTSLARLLHALQIFVQCHNRVFEVLFPQFQSRFLFFPRWCLCVRSHKNPLSCLWPPSFFQRALAFFDFHFASLLPLPYSFLCSARYNSSQSPPPIPLKIAWKKYANQRLPKAVSTCPPQCDRHWCTLLWFNFFCSERQFLGTFPDWHLGGTPLLPSDGPLPEHSLLSTFKEFLKPFVVLFSASFTTACYTTEWHLLALRLAQWCAARNRCSSA